MRSIHLINSSLLLSLFLGSVLAWPDLPNDIPVHFDAGGEVTGWTRTSTLSWFAIPLAALALAAVNYLIAHLLPRWPQLINFPNKQRFFALPSARRAPVIERIRGFLYGISAPLVLIMIVIQLAIYRTAHGEPSDGYILGVLLAGVLLTPLSLGVWLPRIQSEIDRQVREEATDHAHRE